jgi:hypothetical protein
VASLDFVAKEPVLTLLAGEWDENADHLLCDPEFDGGHAFLEPAVAAAEGDDPVGARAAVLLECAEDFFDGSAVGFAEEFGEVLSVFEGHGGSLAGVRSYGVGGVADENGAAGAPTGKAGDVVDRDVEDLLGGLDELRDRLYPVAMEREEALLDFRFSGGGGLLAGFERGHGGAPPHGSGAGWSDDVEVAEEAVLAEDEVDALIGAWSDGSGVVDARADSAGGGEAAVDGFGSVGHDRLPDLRADAVGTDDEVSFDTGSVGEVGDDGLAGGVFDGGEAFVVADGYALAFGAVDEDAMQCGAGDHDASLSVAGGVAGGVAGEEFAVLIFEGPLVGGYAGVANRIDNTGCSEDIHAVGGEPETATSVAGAGGGFEDVDAEAGLFEEEREDRPGDTAADDENAFGIRFEIAHLIST